MFKPEEVHALRALAEERPKQVIQTGLQRRYSKFYQVAESWWPRASSATSRTLPRNGIGIPAGCIPPDPASERSRYWMIFREYSAGLAGELGSHQIDVASWMFNAQPEYVMGMGGQEFIRDGRDIYDNIQLLYRYRRGQKLTYSAISTNQHLPLFGGTRAECGETIMGTGGTIEITLGTDEGAVHRAVVLRAAAAAGDPGTELPGAAADWRRHAGEHGKRQERFPAAAGEGPVPATANCSWEGN